MMVTSSSSPRSARRLPVLVALALFLGGCTLFDTRPAVEILPGGDLVGGFTTQLRVEAGGAPEARILVDGKALGEPIPTGTDVRLDTSTVPEGVHEIVARVEQSPSPRTSAPRRLEIRKFGYRVPVEIVQLSAPWEPIVVQVRSPDPLAVVTPSARGTSGSISLPFDPPVPSADRRTWTVAVGGGTLKELGGVSVAAEVTDDMGLQGAATAYFPMPTRIAVTFQQPTGEVAPPFRVVATTAVRVPSATLWASSLTQPSFRLRDVGPSPWNVTIGETDLVPGVYTFEFRRDDVDLAGNTTATVTLPTVRPSCSVERFASTVTSERCGLVSFAVPPSTARLEGTAFGEPWPGDLYLLPFDARTWRICPSSPRWKRGPATFTATAVALDDRNAVVERVSCSFTMGWEWSAAGGEPVADRTGNVRGEVLAVRGDAGGTTRLALLGLAPDAAAGGVRIGSRAPADATFTFPAEVVPATVARKAVVSLDAWTAIAWIPAQGLGVATGLIERGPGTGFGWWPLAFDDFRATDQPAIGADGTGPGAAAWVEELPDGTSVARVRTDPIAWLLLPPVAPEVPGARIAAPSVAPSGPLGYGPHLSFLEVAPGGAQRVRVVAWDGTAWVNWPVQFPAIPAGTLAEDPVRVVLSTDRLRAWVHVNSARAGVRAYAWSVDAPGAWTGAPLLLDPQGGTVRADAVAVRYANDGRPPTTAITLTRPDGQAEVRICPTTSGGDCLSLGPVGGAPHRAIALDAWGMTVAWTASDGTVHVRTLTP